MIVPNYVPDPLEVPANITEAPYAVKIDFIRRVAFLFLGSAGLTGLLTRLVFPVTGLAVALGGLAICLVGLDLLRIALRGKPAEGKVTALCLPIVLVLVAWVLREVQMSGWPIYQALAGPICIVIYTALAGRDFSFVGCGFLTVIVSSAAIAGESIVAGLDRRHAAFALGSGAVLIVYLVYDLASLLARRRVGEELAAVADLYRDVFNFFGYAVRMVKHWRKHKIWTAR